MQLWTNCWLVQALLCVVREDEHFGKQVGHQKCEAEEEYKQESLIWPLCLCGVQVFIVQYGGAAFQTTPLTLQEWEVCVGVGLLSLPLRELLRRIKPFWALKGESDESS